MAIKFNAGVVRRGDLFFVDPTQIIVREELRGRKFAPDPEKIIEMAMSIFDAGQRQPIECRRVGEDKRLQVTAGFTRTNSVRLIKEGFIGTDDVHRHDPEFQIQVKVVECNEETALKNNIIENAHRNGTSDIDDAHNHNRLRETYGYSDVKIAELYMYKGTVKVGRLRQLLSLSEQEQRLVHEGKLPTSGAIDLLALSSEQRTQVIADLQKEDGKINGSSITDQVRDHMLADAESKISSDGFQSPPEPTKSVARNMRNIRTFFEKLKDNEEKDDSVRRFATDILKWVGGKSSDKSMDNALSRLMETSKLTDAVEKAALSRLMESKLTDAVEKAA